MNSIPVLYENEEILVINKPAGLAVQGGNGISHSLDKDFSQILGYKIFLVHRLDRDTSGLMIVAKSAFAANKWTKLIGSNAYIDGKPNKAALTTFLLASENNAHAIDNIVHPAVAKDFESSGMEWMECAIMYESGFDRLVDCVVAVTAPEEVRIERIMKRDGITREKAKEWMSRQWNQEKVRARACYEITNDGIRDIDAQIDEMMRKLNYKE